MDRRYHPPAAWRSLLEARAPAELASLAVTRALSRRLPQGDGHTVLLIPGFLAPDTSTLPMRQVLNSIGYEAVGWGQGVNTGPRAGTVRGMQEKLGSLAEESGGEVSIIGWSLGGLYARMLARTQPQRVRFVITLVAPFRFDQADRSRASVLYRALEQPEERHVWRSMREPPLLVPATSIFTRLDGVIDWRACLDDPRPNAESIEIRGASHFGMGHNPGAMVVIADRLAQTLDAWAPYEPRGPWKRFIVPFDTAAHAPPDSRD